MPPRGPSNRLPQRQTPATPIYPLVNAPLGALSLAPRFSRIARLAFIHPLPRHHPVCSLSVGRGCGATLYTLINFIISHYHRRARARRLSYSCWIDSCEGVRCNFLVGVGNYIIASVKERELAASLRSPKTHWYSNNDNNNDDNNNNRRRERERLGDRPRSRRHLQIA